jgi:hypothetical protein
MAQPYFQAGAAATLGGMGPANLGELDTNKYMSPYLQNVVQSTADILGQQNRQDMSGALGTAIQSGAGFGDRSGIAAANLNRQQMMGMGSTIGNLLNQGYMQAQGVAQQQQSADLASRQANLARLLQGGQSIGQLGAGAQGAGVAGGQALLGAGTQEQQTEQAGLSALYNQYQQGLAYPFQTTQFLGNIGMGTGALSGATTTETKPAGFFSGLKRGGKVVEGVGYRRGGIVPESMGGHVSAGHMGEGYADGGSPQMDYASMVIQQLFGGMDPNAGAYGRGSAGIGSGGFVPQANLPVGQLNAPKISQSAPQTSISDLVDTGGKLYEGAENVGKWWEENNPSPPVIDENDPQFKNWDREAAGGRTTRTGLAAGGMPYDPQNTGYVPDNAPKETPELLQPKGPSQTQSGLSKVADIAKIVGAFMANGGVAGRHGYATDGAVDDAKEVLRKKLLGGDTGFSPEDAAGVGQIFATPAGDPVAPVAVTPAVSPTVLPGLKPLGGSPHISLPTDKSGAEKLVEGFGNTGADVRAYNAILDATRKSGAPVSTPLTPFVDFFTKPSVLQANEEEREKTQKMLDWYNANKASLGADPRAVAAAVENPEAYYNERAGNLAYDPTALIGPGLGPVGGLTGGNVTDQYLFTPKGLAGVSPAGLAGGAALPAPVTDVAAEPIAVAEPGQVPLDLATGKPATDTASTDPAADAKNIYKATALNDEGTRVDDSGDDPQGHSLAGFHERQYGKPLDQVTARDISAAQDKWWNEQGGDQIAEKYGANFAAAYVNLSMLNPNFAREALKNAGGDPNLFFDKFKSRLMRLDKWEKYGKGWSNRIDRADALASGATPTVSGGGGGGGGGGGTLGDAAITPRDVTDTRPDGGRNDQPAPGLGGKNFFEKMVDKAGGPENIILPFLSGLGKMAGSQSRFLGTAILEGVGGGAEAYMNRQKQLADIAGTKATAFSNISTALSTMLVKDATGNVFVPLKNGNFQLLWDYMDNPEGPSILGQQADLLLRELNAGGPSGTEQLQEIIKTIPSGVEGGKVPPETPVSEGVSNIVWSPNSDRAILEDKALARSQGRQGYLDNSTEKFNLVQREASAAVTNARDMNLTINTVADALANPAAAQPGPGGDWRSWVDSNIKFIANIVGVDVSSLGDMSNQSAVLNKLATMSAGRMLPEGQNALQALQEYISSNPNMNMPPEAMKAITVSLMQANQQALEKNVYYRNYMQRSGGFNMGADQAFYSEIGRLHQQEHDQLMTILGNAELVKKLTSGISFEEAQARIKHAFDGNVSPVLARFFAAGAY